MTTDEKISLLGLVLIPVAIAAVGAAVASWRSALSAAEARGRAQAQTDQLAKTVLSLHGRIDAVRRALEALARVLIAKRMLSPDFVIPERSTDSQPPRPDPEDG